MTRSWISITWAILCCLTALWTVCNAQTTGDYRSIVSGNWSDIASWQEWNGSAWISPLIPPGASNSVFIELGHTITLTGAAECADLNLRAENNQIRLITGPFTLRLSGKLRAYIDAAPGTSAGALPTSWGWINTDAGGKIMAVGSSRAITHPGEWGGSNPGWRFEIALNPGQTGTFNTMVKAAEITITSGTVVFTLDNAFMPDSGDWGTGSLTVKRGAALRLKAGALQRFGFSNPNSHFGTLTVDGLLAYDSTTVGVIGASLIHFNGTVEYMAAGAETLVTRGANTFGANPDRYANLRFGGSGLKTLGVSTTVVDTLELVGTAGADLGGNVLTYGASSTVAYSAGGTVTVGNEWAGGPGPGNGVPHNVLLRNNTTLQMPPADRAVTGDLTIQSGTLSLNTGSGDLFLGGSWTRDAAAGFVPNNRTVFFNGTAGQVLTVTGGGAEVFDGLGIQKPSGDLLLGNDVTVDQTMFLGNGHAVTGPHVLTLGATGNVSRTHGYVIGNFKKVYTSAGSKDFEVGTANAFSPVTVTATAGSGDFTVECVQGPHPQAFTPNSLQRYWVLTSGGISTADLAFHYLDVDVVGDEANYGLRRFDTRWSNPGGTVDTATNIATISGVNSFSDWTLAECPGISLTPAVPSDSVGKPYNAILTATGGTGPWTFARTLGTLPPGLTVSPGGSLTGVPTLSGTFTFTVTATDANGCSGSQEYTVQMDCPVLVLHPPGLPGASKGAAYSQTVTAQNGTPPYSFSLSSGSLPPGVLLSRSGLIAGTPTDSGLFSFRVTATDSFGCTGWQDYQLQVIIQTFTLSIVTTGSGTVAKNPDMAAYARGTPVQLSANPAGGWHFAMWSGDTTGTVTPITMVMYADKHITAAFEHNSPTVTAHAGPNGSITPSGSVVIPYNADQRFVFTPNQGYHVDSAFVDGAFIDSLEGFTFRDDTADHTIDVFFAIDMYPLNVTVAGSGVVAKNPDQPLYAHGTSIELTASADRGWLFQGWSGDTTSSADPLTLVMTSAKNVLATFTPDSAYQITYRSIVPESLALARDEKGKLGKYIKRKAYNVDFAFDMGPVAAALTLQFSMSTTGVLTNGEDTVYRWTNVKKVTTAVLDVTGVTAFHVIGRGFSGKQVKVNYIWATSPSVTGGKITSFVENTPRMRMPNRVNLLYETFLKGGYGQDGMVVGEVRPDASKQYGWFQTSTYTDVLKTLIVAKTLEMQDKPARGFDQDARGKQIVGQKKSLPPTKFNDVLLADMICLKLNITASGMGKVPRGFGELIYNDGGTGNPLNGKMVKEIAARGDELMMGVYNPVTGKKEFAAAVEFRNVDTTIQRINRAFEGVVDTVSFADTLRMQGVRPLVEVVYLQANAGVEAARISAMAGEVAQVPVVYELYQNYPNPFNPVTTIQFDLPVGSVVTLKVYNVLGQEVATLLDHEQMDEGVQAVEFSPVNISSGVYFYRIMATRLSEEGEDLGTYEAVRKMIILR